MHCRKTGLTRERRDSYLVEAAAVCAAAACTTPYVLKYAERKENTGIYSYATRFVNTLALDIFICIVV